MGRSGDLIPKPKSRFLKVTCKVCGADNVVFSHASFPVRCKVCGTVLVKTTGGKAAILKDKAEIVAELG